MVRRNDVVYNKNDEFYSFYGRVSRILPDGRVETIDCGKYIRVQDQNDLVVVNYTGKYDEFFSPAKKKYVKIWRPMPTLRQLKQMASCYDKTVWKRNRTGLYCVQTRFMDKENVKNG
jgi:hypothetical protein